MKKSGITNKDLLQAIQRVDQKIDLQKEEILTQVDAKIDDVLISVNKFADEVKKDMSELKQDLKGVKDKLNNVESTVNTQLVKKTDLEEVFATFEYKKVNKLTNLLQQKKILNQTEAQAILSV